MKIKDVIEDKRIDAYNVLIETSIGEYFELSKEILERNEFQRRRVNSYSSVYSLLKSDIKAGCVMPPIVLALSISNKPPIPITDKALMDIISANSDKLIILDGLQRTYTIKDIIKEYEEKNDPELRIILQHPLRIEIYVGINKLGILYRMLTLNTGQTPMSSRHQIEIIYSNYIKEGLDGIKLLTELDDETPSKPHEYRFRDIIEGFTSYLERDYLTIDRLDILDNIKSLEKLANEKKSADIFMQFSKAYDKFVEKMVELSGDWKYNPESLSSKLTGPPFAKEARKIFNKSQVMTGFGSGIGKLIDIKALNSFTDIEQYIDAIKKDDFQEGLNNLLIRLDKIRSTAKKIGNDQRLFFHFFFREIFDRQSDGYLNFKNSIEEAFVQYERKT